MKRDTHMTISFSYAYLNGFDRLMVSSPSVQIIVHRPNRAMSPRMTRRVGYGRNQRALSMSTTYCSSTQSPRCHPHCALLQYAPRSMPLLLCLVPAAGIHHKMYSCSFCHFARQLHPSSSHTAHRTRESSGAYHIVADFS